MVLLQHHLLWCRKPACACSLCSALGLYLCFLHCKVGNKVQPVCKRQPPPPFHILMAPSSCNLSRILAVQCMLGRLNTKHLLSRLVCAVHVVCAYNNSKCMTYSKQECHITQLMLNWTAQMEWVDLEQQNARSPHSVLVLTGRFCRSHTPHAALCPPPHPHHQGKIR
jgi:hypothetical protein